MLSCLCRCFITEAISYGCMGRSNTSASTASASGLDGCFDAIMYPYAGIRIRVQESSGFLASPRRVRIFAAEKGMELTLQDVDILAGQSRTPEFLAKNPSGAVPVLEFKILLTNFWSSAQRAKLVRRPSGMLYVASGLSLL